MSKQILYTIQIRNGFTEICKIGDKIPIVGTQAKPTPEVIAELCKDLYEYLTDTAPSIFAVR